MRKPDPEATQTRPSPSREQQRQIDRLCLGLSLGRNRRVLRAIEVAALKGRALERRRVLKILRADRAEFLRMERHCRRKGWDGSAVGYRTQVNLLDALLKRVEPPKKRSRK